MDLGQRWDGGEITISGIILMTTICRILDILCTENNAYLEKSKLMAIKKGNFIIYWIIARFKKGIFLINWEVIFDMHFCRHCCNISDWNVNGSALLEHLCGSGRRACTRLRIAEFSLGAAQLVLAGEVFLSINSIFLISVLRQWTTFLGNQISRTLSWFSFTLILAQMI